MNNYGKHQPLELAARENEDRAAMDTIVVKMLSLIKENNSWPHEFKASVIDNCAKILRLLRTGGSWNEIINLTERMDLLIKMYAPPGCGA